MVTDQAAAARFAESWLRAWNAHDLEAVLAHFHENIEFSSPLIGQFADAPTGRLVGKAALRAYWQTALARLPELHFEPVALYVGVNCLLIIYRGHRGVAAEVLDLDAQGLVVRGRALYAEEWAQ